MTATPKKPQPKAKAAAKRARAKVTKKAPARQAKPKPRAPKPLSARRQLFVEHVAKGALHSEAYKLAGYRTDGNSAEVGAARLLRDPRVAAAVAELRAKSAERAEIDAAWVLRQWADIATADPNDLVQYRRACCRHCWGIGHAYQWTQAELERETARLINMGKSAPDGAGGVGFDLNRSPNPECPECGGEGRGRMLVADTRHLRGAARRLYAGVKLGKDGLEVKMRDQDGALANIAKHLGMFPSKVELTGKNGAPIQHQAVAPDLSNLSDDELANLEAIAAKIGRAAQPGADPG
jgi:hypothetical protein